MPTISKKAPAVGLLLTAPGDNDDMASVVNSWLKSSI